MKLFKIRPGTVIFYVVLAFIVLVMMLATFSMKDGIEAMLYDYENSLPKYTVEKIFEENFKNPDFNYLISLCEEKPHINPGSDITDLIEILEDKIEDKEITYSYVAGTQRMGVNVKAGGEKFARFTIKESEKKTPHGNPVYVLDKVTLYYDEPTITLKFKLPFNCKVTVGDVLLEGDYVTETDISEDRRTSIPESASGAYLFTSYRCEISGLYSVPEIVCTNDKGEQVELTYNEESGEYEYNWKFDDALKEEMTPFVLEAIHAYAAYMQADMSWKEIRGYFYKESELYDRIYENPNSFVLDHDGYYFENDQTDEFFMYENGIVFCRVKFTQVLTRKYKEDFKDYVDLNLYMKQVDGQWKIFEMETN